MIDIPIRNVKKPKYLSLEESYEICKDFQIWLQENRVHPTLRYALKHILHKVVTTEPLKENFDLLDQLRQDEYDKR